MELTREELISRKKLMLNKIDDLENRIVLLQNKENAHLEDCPSSSTDDDLYNLSEDNDYLEPVSVLKHRLEASEKLTDIELINYTYKNMSTEDGIGSQREVKVDAIIKNWLKVSIKYIELMQGNRHVILFLTWKVDGDLARSELVSLSKYIKTDLPGLYARLEVYADLAQQRSIILEKFSEEYNNYFKIHCVDGGILLKWRDFFKITWSLKYCEYSEDIINFIDVDCSQREREFSRESRNIIEELINIHQTAEEKWKSLKELAACAIRIENAQRYM